MVLLPTLWFQYATSMPLTMGEVAVARLTERAHCTSEQSYIIVSIIVPQTAQNVNIYNIFNLLLLFEVYKWQKLCYNR